MPEDERHGRVADQGLFWFLSNFHFFAIAIGFVGPSLGLSMGFSILAGALGMLGGGVLQGFHASQGPEMGLPQMIQPRAQFGFRGVIIPLIGALVSMLGYNLVSTVLVASGAHSLWGLDRTAVALAVALTATVLAIFGHDWLHRAFRLLFWISLPLFAVLTLAIMFGHAGGAAPHQQGHFSWPAFLTQMAAAMSFNLGGAPYVSDYSRYLPRKTSRVAVIAYVFGGASLSGMWLIGVGAWLATHIGSADSLMALHLAGDAIVPGLGSILVAASICALVATVGMTDYSAMMTFVTAIDCFRRVKPTRFIRVASIIILTGVWGAVALFLNGDAINYVNAVMVIVLYFLVPWTAVNLIDYFILRKGAYSTADIFTPRGIYGAWNVKGLFSYGLGFAASVPFFVVPSVYTGPLAVAIGGCDIGWLVGLATSGGAYLIASRTQLARIAFTPV